MAPITPVLRSSGVIGSASVGMLFVQLRGETDRTEEEVAPGNSDLEWIKQNTRRQGFQDLE